MSGYQLAKDSGVSKQTVSNLLRGLKRPSWDTACALADALGVDVGAFRAVPLSENPTPIPTSENR